MNTFRKGSEIDLYVEKLAFGGKAIAHLDGFVFFIEHAVPGQQVRVRITRKKRQYAEAKVLDVLSQSARYVDPSCKHFGVCGGCYWQDIPYEDQLHWKRLHVYECLRHLAGIEEATVNATIASPLIQWYRNKMEFTFSNRRWLSQKEIESQVQFDRSVTLGLHVRGFFDKIFDVEECYLESPQAVEILKEVRTWCRKSGIPPYSTKDHSGFWRFLVIREGKRTGQTLVHLITTDREDGKDLVDRLSEDLLKVCPRITTFVHSVSSKKAQVALGETSRVLFGPGFIEEILSSLRFRISAHSFFQTNTYGAEKLYETVRQFSGLTGDETVWDLYCGTGSIALFVAPRARRVVGFEVVQEAVDDAYVNSQLNGVDNCYFQSGDLKDVIQKALGSTRLGGAPDVVITDPPRAGMHPNVVDALLDISPRRIVAVSCNPATLARDLAFFLDSYHVREVQPFDMFPHTPHIECVVKLDRKT